MDYVNIQPVVPNNLLYCTSFYSKCWMCLEQNTLIGYLWCAYFTDFVMRQPSSRSTLPGMDEREETFETEAGSRWISGRSSTAGTAANGLTER